MTCPTLKKEIRAITAKASELSSLLLIQEEETESVPLQFTLEDAIDSLCQLKTRTSQTADVTGDINGIMPLMSSVTTNREQVLDQIYEK